MNARSHDLLPQSAAISAIVRRIVFKLDAELRFNGHPGLSHEERAGLFMLSDASAILDRIAVLPGMAAPEERARRDLLELYDIFDQTMPTGGHTEPQETCAVCVASPAATAYGQRIQTLEDAADSFDAQQAQAEEAHNKQLDALESAAVPS